MSGRCKFSGSLVQHILLDCFPMPPYQIYSSGQPGPSPWSYRHPSHSHWHASFRRACTPAMLWGLEATSKCSSWSGALAMHSGRCCRFGCPRQSWDTLITLLFTNGRSTMLYRSVRGMCARIPSRQFVVLLLWTRSQGRISDPSHCSRNECATRPVREKSTQPSLENHIYIFRLIHLYGHLCCHVEARGRARKGGARPA